MQVNPQHGVATGRDASEMSTSVDVDDDGGGNETTENIVQRKQNQNIQPDDDFVFPCVVLIFLEDSFYFVFLFSCF